MQPLQTPAYVHQEHCAMLLGSLRAAQHFPVIASCCAAEVEKSSEHNP